MQAVIVLYLFDNETSWMILISAAVGLLIEVWKLRKAVTFTVRDRERERGHDQHVRG
jgi:hypothetical protein